MLRAHQLCPQLDIQICTGVPALLTGQSCLNSSLGSSPSICMHYKLPQTQGCPPCVLSMLTCFSSTVPLAGLPLLCPLPLIASPTQHSQFLYLPQKRSRPPLVDTHFIHIQQHKHMPPPPFTQHILHKYTCTCMHTHAYTPHSNPSPPLFNTQHTNTHAHIARS